jgi:hypothetical protein
MIPPLSNPRPPLVIRLAARFAVISLVIALATLLFAKLVANLQSPGLITLGLKLIFFAASAVGVTALLLWVIFSGVHIVFGRPEEDRHEPPGGLF